VAALRATANVEIANAPADATKGTPAEKQRQLIAILKSDAKPAEKAVACKRLAVYGTKDAVPALHLCWRTNTSLRGRALPASAPTAPASRRSRLN